MYNVVDHESCSSYNSLLTTVWTMLGRWRRRLRTVLKTSTTPSVLSRSNRMLTAMNVPVRPQPLLYIHKHTHAKRVTYVAELFIQVYSNLSTFTCTLGQGTFYHKLVWLSNAMAHLFHFSNNYGKFHIINFWWNIVDFCIPSRPAQLTDMTQSTATPMEHCTTDIPYTTILVRWFIIMGRAWASSKLLIILLLC